MRFKKGPFTEEERRFIEQNGLELTIDEIAEALRRNPKEVRRFALENGIRTKEIAEDEFVLQILRSRHYYRELKEQLTPTELEFFENEWVNFYLQFNEDVTHTEELQILEVIRTEILIHRSMKDRLQVMESIAALEKMIEEEMAQPKEDRDTNLVATLNAQLGALIGSKTSYISEHEKLLTKKERYLKDLKATREQRKRQADDAKTNFSMWLRELEKIDVREKEGFDMEVQAIAAAKARKELAEYHEYRDGMVDRPLLNADTISEEDTL